MTDKIIGMLLIMFGLALMIYSIDCMARTISDVIFKLKNKIGGNKNE